MGYGYVLVPLESESTENASSHIQLLLQFIILAYSGNGSYWRSSRSRTERDLKSYLVHPSLDTIHHDLLHDSVRSHPSIFELAF
jgi:hypothetical protein